MYINTSKLIYTYINKIITQDLQFVRHYIEYVVHVDYIALYVAFLVYRRLSSSVGENLDRLQNNRTFSTFTMCSKKQTI